VLLIALALGLPATGLEGQATPPRTFTVTANAGFVDASGNSEITTLSGDERVEYRPPGTAWTLTQSFGAVYGRTDGATSANRIKGGIRVAHVVEDRLSAFVSGEYEKNRFAGIRRRFEEVVSLAIEVVRAPRTHLSIEMGAAFNQQRDLQDVNNAFVAARSAADFKQNFTESAYFQQKVELLPNLKQGEDLRVNSESALVAPLSKRFAVKLSYAIRFDNLPEPGFERTDRVFTSGLQVTL
jgi:putative salt-induced outer membrane protein